MTGRGVDDWRQRGAAPPPSWARWADPDDEVVLGRVRLAIIVVLAAAVLAFVARGADRPSDPTFDDESPLGSGVEVDGGDASAVELGFGEVSFTVVADGVVAESPARCALLADTGPRRTSGFIGLDGFSGYDGMVFSFAADATSAFHMRGVTFPLVVAFYDADGVYVSAQDMAPCAADGDCPTYDAAAPYRWALEIDPARQDELGVGPGSVLEVGGACS